MNKLGNRPIFKDTKEPRCAVKVPTYQLYGNCDRVIVSGCVTALQWSSSARVGLLVGNALRLSASDERVDSSLRNSGSSSSSNEEAESVSGTVVVAQRQHGHLGRLRSRCWSVRLATTVRQRGQTPRSVLRRAPAGLHPRDIFQVECRCQSQIFRHVFFTVTGGT